MGQGKGAQRGREGKWGEREGMNESMNERERELYNGLISTQFGVGIVNSVLYKKVKAPSKCGCFLRIHCHLLLLH